MSRTVLNVWLAACVVCLVLSIEPKSAGEQVRDGVSAPVAGSPGGAEASETKNADDAKPDANAAPASQPASDAAAAETTDAAEGKRAREAARAVGFAVSTGKIPGLRGSGPMVFNNAPVEVVFRFLSRLWSKPIIPRGPDVMTKKITIVSETALDADEMADIAVKALLQNGIYLDERETVITAMTIEEARRSGVLTQDVDLLTFLPGAPDEIINGKFKLKHTLPSVIKEAIKDILPENAALVANDAGRVLFITDTRAALERYAAVIKGLDVPDVSKTEMRIFRLKHAKAEEVAQIMNQVLVGRPPSRRRGRSARPSQPGQGLVIIAEPTYNWIVAIGDKESVASAEKLARELDQERPKDLIPQVIKIKYADVNDLSQNLLLLLREQTRAKAASERISIVPYKPASMLLVYGNAENRKLVADLVAEMDISETEERVIKTYDLLHADAAEVTEQIMSLYEEQSSSPWWWWGRRRGAEKEVSATADIRLNKVIVKASPAMHVLVEKLVRELDVESSAKDLVPPRIFTLRYANAVEIAALLEEIFEEEQTGAGSSSFWSLYLGRSRRKKKTKATRLAGEIKFAADEYSNSLIVITDNSQNFAIIGELVKELDKPVGVQPNVAVVALEHSDAEKIAQKLNYLFAEGGTKQPSSSSSKSKSDSSAQDQEAGGILSRRYRSTKEAKEFVYPWLSGTRRLKKGETPVSTLIGRVRIVPDKRTNSLIITVDEDHRDAVVEIVHALDQPGKQVLIEAIIVEVRHDDTESIGIQFSTDIVSAFTQGELTDQGIRGTAQLNTGNQAVPSVGTNLISTTSVAALIQFLQRKGRINIRSRPHIFVEDNEEAEVFVGQEFPFVTKSDVTNVGISQSVTYDNVGIRLTVTPRIASSGEVDMKVDMEISSIVPDQLIAGNVLVDSRQVTNQVTIKSGETMVVGGLMREENIDIIRKVPLLGDIPLLGLLFRKTDKSKITTELIAFITPHVLSTPSERMESIERRKKETLQSDDIVFDEADVSAGKRPSSAPAKAEER